MRRFFLLTVLLLVTATANVFAADPSVIMRVKTAHKVVALTFDADMTPRMRAQLAWGKVGSWYDEGVIKTLRDRGVPATLFLTGLWIEAYPEVTRELSRDPLFELGNHSYSHGAFAGHCYTLKPIPESEDFAEVQKTETLLLEHADAHVRLFRFPGLCFDRDDIDAVHRADYAIIDGDVRGGDGFQKDPEKIVHTVLSRVRPGSIVVLHMHGGPNAPKTAAALPQIIDALERRGYTFVKVTDLLKFRR